jgi:hypothetical protein
MLEVTVSAEVDAPADRLWAIVADFGNVDWMQGVSHCEVKGAGPGMVRGIFVSQDGPALNEVLEFVDSEARRIGYTIPENVPMPVTDYHSEMAVIDLGDGRSRLDWTCRAEPDGVEADVAKSAVEGMYGVLVGWVKAHAEA